MTNITKKEIDKFNLKFEEGLFILQKGNDVSVFESNDDGEIMEYYNILNASVDNIKSYFSDFTRDINLSSSSDKNCILEIGKPSELIGKGYQIKEHQVNEFTKALKEIYNKGLVVVVGNDKLGVESSVPAQSNKPKI